MMIGSFFFGNYYKVIWEVKFVFDVMFRDFNEFIFLNEGYDWFNFFFLNMEGKMVFLLDEVYQGKLIIVQIMGIWCLNC